MLSESKDIQATPTTLYSNGDVSIRSDSHINKASTSIQRSETPEPNIPSSSFKLSAPLFKKKAKSSEGVNPTANVDSTKELKSTEEVTNARLVKTGGETKIQSQRPPNPFSKSSNNQGKTDNGQEEKQAQPHRPSNPFLKSSIKL